MLEFVHKAIVASYSGHSGAEEAVQKLQQSGIPMNHLSIIGRDWQVNEDVEGFYHSGDTVKEGTKMGTWFGGFFGLFMGMGMFMFPVTGALIVLGPLAGLIAGAISGAGIGALVSSLMTLGIPKDQALKYQERLEAGEFLIVVHGTAEETSYAHEILQATSTTSIATHDKAS